MEQKFQWIQQIQRIWKITEVCYPIIPDAVIAFWA